MFSRLLLKLIRVYQVYLSPLKRTPTCRYYPTCSHYAYDSIKNRGVFLGLLYSIYRILRCNPFSKGGYDPPPQPLKLSQKGKIMKNIILWGAVLSIVLFSFSAMGQDNKSNPVKKEIPKAKVETVKTGAETSNPEAKPTKDSSALKTVVTKDATAVAAKATKDATEKKTVSEVKKGPNVADKARVFSKVAPGGPVFHTGRTAWPDVSSDKNPKLFYENKYYKAQMTIHGGVFSSFILKNKSYKEHTVPKSALKNGQKKTVLQQIDMIKTWHSSFLPFVLNNIKIEKHAESLDKHTFYNVSSTSRNLFLEQEWEFISRKDNEKSTEITFKLKVDKPCTPDLNGKNEVCFPVEITKKYTFYPDSYEIGLDVYFLNTGNSKIGIKKMEIQVPSLHEGESDRGFFNPVSSQKEATCLDADRVQVQNYMMILRGPDKGCMNACSGCSSCQCNRTASKVSVFAKGARWAGIDARYFLMVAIKNYAGDDGGCSFRAVPIKEMPGYGLIITTMNMTGKQILEPGKTERIPLKIFIGPKDTDHLNSVKIFKKVPIEGVNDSSGQKSARLEKSIDWGIFEYIGKPMIWLLKVVFKVVGNWGLAIIFLTILIKLATLYWTNKSMRSMKKMAALKPEMDALQKKYANDKAKLNEEIMALYKKNKVSPLGGCLPMFFQMPIYIAWYYALMASVELYRAPLFGWIDDLTAKDPMYVLPLLMGILMFIQQKITPTSGDNQQAKMMMYFMPIMFTGIMVFLPSGLTLYILTNTVLGLAHQWYMNLTDEPV